jgi:hypothetical protein
VQVGLPEERQLQEEGKHVLVPARPMLENIDKACPGILALCCSLILDRRGERTGVAERELSLARPLFTVFALGSGPHLLLCGHEAFFHLTELLYALGASGRVDEVKVRALMERLENLRGCHVGKVTSGSYLFRVEVDDGCFTVGTVAQVSPRGSVQRTSRRSSVCSRG